MRKHLQQVIVSSVTDTFTIPAFPTVTGSGLVVEVNGAVVPHYMTSATSLTLRTPTLAHAIVDFYEESSAYVPTNVAQATLDFPSIAAGSSQALTVTVKGAVVGQVVGLGLPSNVPDMVIYRAHVSAADTVTVTAINPTAGAIDPPSGVFKVLVE